MMMVIGKKKNMIKTGINVDEPDEGRIQRQDINLFPIIPTIGITFEF